MELESRAACRGGRGAAPEPVRHLRADRPPRAGGRRRPGRPRRAGTAAERRRAPLADRDARSWRRSRPPSRTCEPCRVKYRHRAPGGVRVGRAAPGAAAATATPSIPSGSSWSRRSPRPRSPPAGRRPGPGARRGVRRRTPLAAGRRPPRGARPRPARRGGHRRAAPGTRACRGWGAPPWVLELPGSPHGSGPSCVPPARLRARRPVPERRPARPPRADPRRRAAACCQPCCSPARTPACAGRRRAALGCCHAGPGRHRGPPSDPSRARGAGPGVPRHRSQFRCRVVAVTRAVPRSGEGRYSNRRRSRAAPTTTTDGSTPHAAGSADDRHR